MRRTTYEPVRKPLHVRIQQSPWFYPVMIVLIPAIVYTLGVLAVRLIEAVQGGAL